MEVEAQLVNLPDNRSISCAKTNGKVLLQWVDGIGDASIFDMYLGIPQPLPLVHHRDLTQR